MSVSCVNEISLNDHLEKGTENIDYVSIIERMGYQVDNVHELDSLIILSDILIFRKSDLETYDKYPETRLNSDKEKLELEEQRYAFTFMQNNDLITNEFCEAIEKWNEVPNCNILFHNPYGADQGFTSDGMLAANVYASDALTFNSSNVVNYGCIYVMPKIVKNNASVPMIAVDTDHYKWTALHSEQKTWAIAHAIGLMIRLKPTDEESSIMRPISGLTLNDQNDIIYDYWSGFSDSDITDLVSWYPLKPESISLVHNGSSDTLEQDVAYHFYPMIDALKDYENVDYIYDVTSDHGIKSYTISTYGSGDANITFTAIGTYDVKLTIKKDDIELCSTSKRVNIRYGLAVVDSIAVRDTFIVAWSESLNDRLDISAEEMIFDKDDRNLFINRTDNNTFLLTLKEYGYYQIVMNLKDSNDNLIKSKILHIKMFYRPEMYFPDYFGTLDVFDYRQKVFEVGRECPEDVSDITFTGTNPAYTITVGDGGPLQERLYVLQYEKFYRDAFIPPYRVDRGPVAVLSSRRERKLTKGKSGIIQVPPGRNGYIHVPEPGWMTYQGYYAIVVPDDETYIENN